MPHRNQTGNVVRMGWRSAASIGDAVIVWQGAPGRSRFVVHSGAGAPIAYPTYAEAEARAGSYAEHAHASVWYVEHGRMQLVCSYVRSSR
jgi:hypothetical protein